MANEVNTLNIGGTSYPIYSEGIKVYSATTGGSFLVASGTGNRKIGVSNAISGNDESLTINSGDIYLGESANSLSLGQYATYIYIGEEASNVSLGQEATNVNLGNSANDVYIGESATNIGLGYNAQRVKLGDFANDIHLGEEATSVFLGQGKRTTDENGTITRYTTTKIGENNNALYLGEAAGIIYFGRYASSIILGGGAESIYIGDDAGRVNLGDSATNVSLGESATNVNLGDSATNVNLGKKANNVNLGKEATDVNLGKEATDVILGYGKTTTDDNGIVTKHTTTKIGENNNSVYLGTSANSVSLGNIATNVSLGASASNVSLGAASASVTIGGGANYVWLGASAKNVYLGTSANSVSLGQEANNVNLGYAAQSIQLGDFASELNIGFDASQISIGPNVHQDVDRNTIGINNVGELYITGTHTDIAGEDYESHISMEYDSGSGAMDLNLAAGATGVINIGGTGAHQSSMLNINSDNISLNGSATIDINGTNGIRMTGRDYNFIVQPNVSTINGFNIIHQKNSTIGIVCYTPSASAPALYMTPRAAYSSSATVHLGTTSKRFGYIYTTYGKATNGFTTDSDERLKDFGENIEVDLDALAALRKSYYRWNETSGFENEKDRMLGMSAQEVQKIYPELVDADENGMLSMAYDRLSVVALAAIDKLHNENKELKAENEDLKDRIANLENLVDTILSRIN